MSMEIIFLGTSAGIPTKTRNVSGIVVRYEGDYIFIDVGEGTQRQAIIAGIGLRKNIKIFITHLHGDHVLGLIPMLQSMSLFKRTGPLFIYGPKGIKQFILNNAKFLDISFTYPVYINYLADHRKFDFDKYFVRVMKNEHGKYSYALSIEEKPRPGKFNYKKAVNDGVPKKYWRLLKDGKNVIINGKLLRWTEYVGPSYKGRKIVYSGDTRPIDKMIKFARGADVLIHEATFANDKLDRSIETKHSTAEEAALIAKLANVKILILTHFSARYEDINKLLNEAKKIFPFTYAAEDFLRFEIPPSKRILR